MPQESLNYDCKIRCELWGDLIRWKQTNKNKTKQNQTNQTNQTKKNTGILEKKGRNDWHSILDNGQLKSILEYNAVRDG